MRKRQFFFLSAAIAVCFTLFFLFWWNESSKASSGSSGSRLRVQVVLKGQDVPTFWGFVRQGVLAAEQETGARCTITAPDHENDIDRQIQLMEQAIAARPDAIVLAACDYEKLAPVCREATAKGIPLLLLDSDVDCPDKSCFIGTDNRELGKKLAQLTEEEGGAGCSVGIIAHVEGAATAIQRIEGYRANLSGASGRIKGLAYCGGDVQKAKSQTLEMLREHPEITCMVGMNESSSLGIASALEETGQQSRVKVVAADSSETQIGYLEDGTIRACVVQNPFSMGYLGVIDAVRRKQGVSLSPIVYTDSVIVRQNNLKDAGYQQLIIPFSS